MKPWPRWRAYVLAVAVTAAVLLMRVLAEPWMGHQPFLLVFLIPVILAAYMGGLRPGLFATALSGVSTKLWVFPPFNRVWFEDTLDFAHWLFLLLVGVLISMLFDELQQWRDKTAARSTERRHAATERKVRVGFAIAMAFLGAIGIVSFLSVVRLSRKRATRCALAARDVQHRCADRDDVRKRIGSARLRPHGRGAVCRRLHARHGTRGRAGAAVARCREHGTCATRARGTAR